MWGYLLENRTFDIEREKYKFTGKERDEESSYDYFGARYYLSRIGRWGSVEPLMEEYILSSPYSYSYNNSITFKDFKGFQVLFEDLVKYENVLIENLSLISGLELTLNDGELRYNENNIQEEGTSKSAREFLINAINNQDFEVTVNLSDEGSHAFPTEIYLDPEDIEKFTNTKNVSFGLNVNTKGWAFCFFHEAHHTDLVGLVGDPSKFGIIGDVEKILNEWRKELGKDYGEQMSYRSVSLGKSRYRYIPFNRATLNRLWEGKEPIQGEHRFIKYYE